ncbi:Branched-chain-amino-acid aminotransferase [Vibrio ruber DSM 16370]|uniref:Branched-chain-amino-acid aminotransferase n=1 Tax=Vibrio ruber (strain DSM 16370 / JCM 11486 / BCRC 17186 / CECT 7878 / LMG 23124 / VR1) TaxID=1123498 RepID=A0A1R4LQV7_VIBR1|nr:branched-chain amino acid transaminase [Vibrio ruber]SJN58991.1 Branched-chain-amino-acid aminotransferase [Vibrio ruber DSM 16370]
MTDTVTQTKPQQAHPDIHHPFIYLDDEYQPAMEASIPITTQAFNYGTGVFEGIRAYLAEDQRTLNIFQLDAHIERFINSSKLLLIDHLPSHQEMKAIILELLRKNQAGTDCYIRPIAFKKSLLPGQGFGVKLSGVSSGLAINSLNMPSVSAQKSLRCTISNWRRVSDNSIPARAKITGSYINSALAMESAYRAGYDDAIMLNVHGNIAEATTSNVFLVKKNKLITPAINSHILEGITRSTVITLATEELGLEVEERDISPSELFAANECFLTGTGIEVTPVEQIDHCYFNSAEPHSLTSEIQRLYLKSVRGQLSHFKHWLTSVN